MNRRDRVWQKVEEFKEQYKCDELESMPVDTLELADTVLRLNVIPFDDLRAKHGIEAYLSADFKSIMVDGQTYSEVERGPEWKQNRLRFSMAHEIGHWFMHKEFFLEKGFKGLEAFEEWNESFGGSAGDLEWEADEFAGRLLIPHARLKDDFSRFEAGFSKLFPDWRGNMDLRQKTAEQMCGRYGVHYQSVETRFHREGLWPQIF